MNGAATAHSNGAQPGDRSDLEFVEALRRREDWALASMFDRHRRAVERVLIGILGTDPEVSDIAQDVFVRAIRSIGGFRGDATSLRRWLIRIAVRVAKNRFRHLRVRPWLRSREADPRHEEPLGNAAPAEVVDALRRTYGVVAGLPTDERLVFTLRVLQRMELSDVADACGISVATVKRRVAKATKRFEQRAVNDPVLRSWIQRGPA